MKYLSLFSGIEAASVSWKGLGWEPVAFSEIDPFPCEVLKFHHPNIPNLGDATQIDGNAFRGIDVLVGGSPCQAFSVAGLREGLNDDRGNLTLQYARIVNESCPRYAVWENVPGVLSDKTNAFGCLLGALAGEDGPLLPPGGKWTDAGFVLGPERAIAWRCLDAQYFGLAQRRKRVFLVACPRDGADPREILFEREGVRRDSAPCRKTGESVASNATHSFGRRSANTSSNGWGISEECTHTLDQAQPHVVGIVAAAEIAECLREDVLWHSPTVSGPLGAKVRNCLDNGSYIVGAFGGGCCVSIDVATTTTTTKQRLDFESETLCVHATQDPIVGYNRAHALGANGYQAVAFTQNQSGDVLVTPHCPSIGTNSNATGRNTPKIFQPPYQVRRLTPTECERLQGFPDSYTAIPWRNKPAENCPDGLRYKASGNSMAVNVMRWLGKRIEMVDNYED